MPSRSELLSGLAHSAASALGWKVVEVGAEAVSTTIGAPGAGTALVHGARTAWTWVKIGRSIADGDGVSILASVQEQHGFTIDLSARLSPRHDVSPFAVNVVWSPAEPDTHATVKIDLDQGVAPVDTSPEPSGRLDIRWFEPTRQLDESPLPIQHALQSPTVGKPAAAVNSTPPPNPRPQEWCLPPTATARAGLIDAVHPPNGRKLKPRKRIAVLLLTAPTRHVLRDANVFAPETVLAYAEHLGLAEPDPWTPGWYLRTGNHGALASTPRCRISTVVYLDPETHFGTIVEIPAGHHPRISHLTIRSQP